MSVFDPSQISFNLSGGTTNSVYNNSLGGPASIFTIRSGYVGNLFDDSIPSSLGTDDDYRCFYVVNNNEDEFSNVCIWIESQILGGATAEIGIRSQNGNQRIWVEAISVTGGTMVFDWDDCPVSVAFDADMDAWAENFETALEACGVSSYVVVDGTLFDNGEGVPNIYLFDVQFKGESEEDTHRNYPTIELTSHTLTGVSVTDPVIDLIQNGAPINFEAVLIEKEITPPNGIIFSNPERDNPLSIGTLEGGDWFPVWIKRSISSNSEAMELDSMQIRIKGIGKVN